MKNINPKNYNISPRAVLKQNDAGDLFVVVDRKSRIIMKDGNRILEIVDKIQKVDPSKKVSLLTSAPVCSKTKSMLKENQINIQELHNV